MKIYTLEDLKKDDMELMKHACFLQEPHVLCFGKHYRKLSSLGLIDDENKVTYYGYKLTKKYMEIMET